MSRQRLSGKVRLSPRLIIIELLHEKRDREKFSPFTEKSFLILSFFILSSRPHDVKERKTFSKKLLFKS